MNIRSEGAELLCLCDSGGFLSIFGFKEKGVAGSRAVGHEASCYGKGNVCEAVLVTVGISFGLD